ncbi:MAG: hypothetical protein Q8Q69_03240 [Nitrosopumilaceae archaeon]|nr:hypothetical protein [Nitrosopumilaceae archaeon]
MSDNYDKQRHEIIVKAVQFFLNSKSYIEVVSVALKNQEKNEGLSIATVPKLLKIILSCLAIFDTSKILKKEDIKYYVYGILINFINNEDPQFFAEVITPDTFEELFDGLFDILMLSPKIIESVKQGCVAMC